MLTRGQLKGLRDLTQGKSAKAAHAGLPVGPGSLFVSRTVYWDVGCAVGGRAIATLSGGDQGSAAHQRRFVSRCSEPWWACNSGKVVVGHLSLV